MWRLLRSGKNDLFNLGKVPSWKAHCNTMRQIATRSLTLTGIFFLRLEFSVNSAYSHDLASSRIAVVKEMFNARRPASTADNKRANIGNDKKTPPVWISYTGGKSTPAVQGITLYEPNMSSSLVDAWFPLRLLSV